MLDPFDEKDLAEELSQPVETSIEVTWHNGDVQEWFPEHPPAQTSNPETVNYYWLSEEGEVTNLALNVKFARAIEIKGPRSWWSQDVTEEIDKVRSRHT